MKALFWNRRPMKYLNLAVGVFLFVLWLDEEHFAWRALYLWLWILNLICFLSTDMDVPRDQDKKQPRQPG